MLNLKTELKKTLQGGWNVGVDEQEFRNDIRKTSFRHETRNKLRDIKHAYNNS